MSEGRTDRFQRRTGITDQDREILARLIREELRDPRVGFVTVTDVRLSRDLRHARAFVSFLEEKPEIPLEALRHAAPFLRGRLAREAGLRHAPELSFAIDESMVEGFKVERILDEIGPIEPPTEPPTEDDPT